MFFLKKIFGSRAETLVAHRSARNSPYQLPHTSKHPNLLIIDKNGTLFCPKTKARWLAKKTAPTPTSKTVARWFDTEGTPFLRKVQ